MTDILKGLLDSGASAAVAAIIVLLILVEYRRQDSISLSAALEKLSNNCHDRYAEAQKGFERALALVVDASKSQNQSVRESLKELSKANDQCVSKLENISENQIALKEAIDHLNTSIALHMPPAPPVVPVKKAGRGKNA